MKRNFDFVLNNYLEEFSKNVDANSACYKVICRELPMELQKIFNSSKFIVKGSMGQGNRTQYPCISILNRKITTTTQEGLYIFYLFKKDMKGFYLVMGQGITHFEKRFQKNKYIYARKVATYYQQELIDFDDARNFSLDTIDLGSKLNDLGYGYEQTVILSKYYEKDGYDEDELLLDLEKMISVYDFVVKHMGTIKYSQIIDNILQEQEYPLIPASEALRDLREVPEIIGYKPHDFELKLTEVKAYSEKTRKFEKFENQVVRKVDYIKKAGEDAKTGLIGEELALEYERDRLAAIGLIDYEPEWIAKVSDSFGYDIQSYDFDDNRRVKKIYIEVKSTSSIVDIDFFVSKNELERSYEYDQDYFIYRIFDCNSRNPKFYRAQGKLDNNFILNPITYSASYKWKVE